MWGAGSAGAGGPGEPLAIATPVPSSAKTTPALPQVCGGHPMRSQTEVALALARKSFPTLL